MKLKKLFIYGLLGSALVACDSIDEKDRIIGPIEFESQKNILIEDFTGQKCINCPNAANVIHTMQEMYGKSHVIAVGIHGGGMSVDAPLGLATEEGHAYVSHWEVDGFPSALIDRVGGLNNAPDTWSASVITRLQLTTPIKLSVENNYDDASRKLGIHTIVESKEDFNGKLQLWIIEDHIIGPQIFPGNEMNPEYEHNHVYRASINGLWGEEMYLTSGTQSVDYSITLDKEWVSENVSIVAFFYNDNGVQQTVIESISPKQ